MRGPTRKLWVCNIASRLCMRGTHKTKPAQEEKGAFDKLGARGREQKEVPQRLNLRVII